MPLLSRPLPQPPEAHRSHRAAWLRAAVLGADDGMVSTASLMLGVAAAHSSRATILTAGLAGLAAGAMAMAVGEYVSVASQRDTEHADLALERKELASSPEAELEELTHLYMARGVDRDLAAKVAAQLTTNDALAAHARDELGLLHESLSRPLQAAWTSAAAFSSGAVLPVIALLVAPAGVRIAAIVAIALAGLVTLGWLGARIGGARWRRPVLRVLVGGAAAMAVTAAVGLLTHTTGI